jgi:transcriptional regulator with XRE-family HTH domain
MVERGVRNPSAQVLQQLAKALHISAEQLYIQAGLLSVEDDPQGSVELAVLNDPRLNDEQKSSLLDLYTSYVGGGEQPQTASE